MLVIENLHVFYGGVHALKGVSIEVPTGVIVTLLGANGAGKSTTLRALLRLVEPNDGKITFEGQNLRQMNTRNVYAQGISIVPEGRRIFKDLSVKENLLMGAWAINSSKIIKERLVRIFQIFPVLLERISQRGGTLSGGEQQMLAVGRALMSNPRLLLMDEPSLGLSPLLVSQLFKQIKQIHETENMTILIVEQNARAALKIADYGYVLETGNIVLTGTADELCKDEGVQKAYIGAY